MAVPSKSAKAAHVNMMTDTIIANLPPEGLRSVLRGLLGVDPNLSKQLNTLAVQFLEETRPVDASTLFQNIPFPEPTPAFQEAQRRYRCYFGCGLGFESMKSLQKVLDQVQSLNWKEDESSSKRLTDALAVVDADLVQATTAVQKELLSANGCREMTDTEFAILEHLHGTLLSCKRNSQTNGQEYVFERGLARIEKFGGLSSPQILQNINRLGSLPVKNVSKVDTSVETFQLGTTALPRVFMGLWQFSSPAWGTATRTKIHQGFRRHVDAGFIAYGMYPGSQPPIGHLLRTAFKIWPIIMEMPRLPSYVP